jgi:hypothetical protein
MNLTCGKVDDFSKPEFIKGMLSEIEMMPEKSVKFCFYCETGLLISRP